MSQYLIIGAGVAGISAAKQIRRLDGKSAIHIFSDEAYPFYARIRLPQIISGQAKGPQDLFLYPPQWYENQKIQLHLSEPAQKIDPASKTVITDKGAYQYDKLLLSNGSHSFVPPIPGADLPGVFSLRDMQDALAIADYARKTDSAILIGGGLLGLEAGHALLQAGVKVTVLEMLSRLLPRQTDETAAAILRSQLEQMGFSFQLGVKTKRISGTNQASGVELEDGRALEGQLVLISAGVRCNLQLAQEARLKSNLGVLVDDSLRTNDEHIFAAGDVAEHNGRCYGIWPAAQEQGEIAGKNMAGANELYQGTVTSNKLKVAGIDLVVAGELDAQGRYESKIEKKERVYRKLVFDKNNILIGCILLGDVEGEKKFLKAIQQRNSLTNIT